MTPRDPRKHSLDTKAGLTACTRPFPLDSLLRCEAVNQSKGATMVPASDAQEPEPTTPQITAGNKPPTASADSTVRLTPMPPWLMHWWTPVAVALVLLLICTPIAFWWGGHFHWPSADGISVCITIAGAALAVSTWQQRNDENAFKAQAQRELEADRQEREQIRLEQIERDEYWKRREHILHTLDSNNPGIRLAAVSLLAELADSAAHSGLLNPTAQQQLQQHIISTLCLQMRHEGQPLEAEGTKEEHAEIQAAIFRTILTRIDIQKNDSSHADWSTELIKITSCIVHTPVLIANLTTHATLDFSRSKFLAKFEINNATIPTLLWEGARFIGELTTQNNSIIGTRSLPPVAPYGRYLDTTFLHNSEKFTITLTSYANCELQPTIYISNCKFTSKSTSTSSPIQIDTQHDNSGDEKKKTQNLHIRNCQLADTTIDATYINSQISIVGNRITGHLQINLIEVKNEYGLLERTSHPTDRILLQNNVIHPRQNDKPIVIINYTDTDITTLLTLDNNHVSRRDNFSRPHTLECKIDTNTPNPFRFLERRPGGQIVHTWQTGGGPEDLASDLGPYLSLFSK